MMNFPLERKYELMGLDTFALLCRHFLQRDNFCDFLLSFRYTQPFLKLGLFQNERICS